MPRTVHTRPENATSALSGTYTPSEKTPEWIEEARLEKITAGSIELGKEEYLAALAARGDQIAGGAGSDNGTATDAGLFGIAGLKPGILIGAAAVAAVLWSVS